MGTNETATKKPAKKGTTAKQIGGFLMFLGVILAVIMGSFGALPAVLFFGGLISLIVGIAIRDNNPS